ncbi:MAG: hypothetical protein JWM51_1148 [Microbacteriaceae bacterium]|nr:hypothetical protein [Microbacteriaceae bacterium]
MQALSMTDTQNEPMQGGNHATDAEKLAGIIGQVKGDITLGNEGDIRLLLQQRLSDAGIELDDSEFEKALADATA